MITALSLILHLALCYVVYTLLRGKGYDVLPAAVLGFFWCIGLIVWVFTDAPSPK